MKILVLNCGSSSLKYQLISMENEDVLASGLCERIGIEGSKIIHKSSEKYEEEKPMKTHEDAIKIVIDMILDKKYGVLKDVKEIDAVGHRVVHGGETFSKSIVIDENVKEAIKKCSELAPLHNPANLMGINACEKLIPNVFQVAVFDTAFHQTMPAKAYLYGLPYELYEKYKVRRYGFHGTSHKYVSEKAVEILKKDKNNFKVITCHLGNGGSIAAIKDGKCMDTSMGFTPLEGLIMGTRCGDIDPAAISFIMEKENLDNKGIDELMNKKSGVLGISGISSDFRDVEKASNEGNKRAKVALDMFHYRVAKYIGEYTSVLNGVDAVVFTAGLGENSKTSRQAICDYLSWLGICIDDEKNSKRGEDIVITTPDSKVKVVVIPTNEEIVIARDTKELLTNSK